MFIVHVTFGVFRSSGAVCEGDESNEFGIKSKVPGYPTIGVLQF